MIAGDGRARVARRAAVVLECSQPPHATHLARRTNTARPGVSEPRAAGGAAPGPEGGFQGLPEALTAGRLTGQPAPC
jgi:hypothetical protein